jgi:hypothetical protein
MKKIFVYSIIISGAIFFSCTKLKEDPQSFLTPDQFYKTQNDAIAAVNVLYHQLNHDPNGQQGLYNSLYNTGMDFMSDDLDAGPGSPNPDVQSLSKLAHSATVVRGKEIWQQHYANINRANVAIEKIPGIEFDQSLKDRLLGEALFIRALHYFDLVRLYGAVPLSLTDQTVLPLEQLQLPRTSVDSIYAQIIADLTASAEHFNVGTTGEPGRATEGAAKSLLSKVYLTKRDWANAVVKSEEVINGPYGYDLESDYSHVFLPAYKNGKEHIFSAQFLSNAGSQGNATMGRDIFTGIPGLKGSYGDQVRFYTVGNDNFFSIYKLYSANDKRRNVTFATSYVSPVNGKVYGKLNDPAIPNDSTPFLNKYWDPANVSNTAESAANTHIIRFAEVLLIHAEAENELNGPTDKAYASLNRVRARAGLDPLTVGLNQDQFRDSVYLDRRLELVNEFQRWFDLIRQTGSAQTGVGPDGRGTLLINLQKVGKTNVAAKHYLFPIPQLEIDRNKNLSQNPGW